MVLGSSELHGGGQLAPAQIWTALIVAPLSEALGEPAEIFARTIWPTDDLPAKVAKWCARENPDVVVIDVNGYWFMYESVPMRVNRWLGKAGKPVVAGGAWAGRTPWISYNPVARSVRRWAQSTVGGDTHFSTQHVIDITRQCVRVVLQGEDRVVQVRVSKRGNSYNYGRRGDVRRDARKMAVHNGLSGFCRDLHVDYVGPGSDEPPSGATRQGDGLHSDAAGQEIQAKRWMKRLLPLCRASQEAAGVRT